MKLFIDYHSQINDQMKRANQNVEWYLWSYCLYMQDDWFIWLFMTEFVDNNAISSSIEQSAFFLNKSFHSHMSFDLNSIEHEITQARILLQAYQDWLELVNDLVKIWSRSDSNLTQIWFNTLFLSQHSFLSSTSYSFTSSSFRVTNTSLSSLAQSLNIT